MKYPAQRPHAKAAPVAHWTFVYLLLHALYEQPESNHKKVTARHLWLELEFFMQVPTASSSYALT